MSHIAKLSQRNVAAATLDYASDAVMVWAGDAQGCEGTYQGTRNIEYTLETFISGINSINFTIQSVDASYPLNGSVNVVANLSFVGSGHLPGSFNGTVSAFYSYVYEGDVWLISQEVWNFASFTTEYSGLGGYFAC